MAVSNQTNKVVYVGDGGTVFPYSFKIFASSDLLVQKYTISSGVTTDLTETTDYSVSGVGVEEGGDVTLTDALSSSYKLIITRVLPFTQAVDYVENDPFPAETHEEALDRAAMRDQQLQEQIDRCVKVDSGSGSSPDDLIDDINTAVGSAESSATTATNAKNDAVTAKNAAEAAAENFEFASKAEAEAGVNTTKSMNPLRTAEAIAALVTVPVKATGAEIDAGTNDDKFATAKAIADSGLASETAWTDYSAVSTVTGWASFTDKIIRIKTIGDVVFVDAYILGTSNATSASFTIPHTASSQGSTKIYPVFGVDNGVTLGTPARATLNASSSTVTVTKDMAGATWTSSGTKHIIVSFFFVK
jgi:hypothetical protein